MYQQINDILDTVKLAPGKHLIGLAGAGSVGKTSLAQEMLRYIPRSMFVGSTSRSTFKRMGYENEAAQHNMTEQQKWELQQAIQIDYVTHFAEKVKLLNSLDPTDIFIFDRTLADHRSYCIFQCNKSMEPEDYLKQSQITAKQLKLFSSLLYCPYPTDFVAPSDGFRDSDMHKETVTDALIFKALSSHDYASVGNGTPKQRFLGTYNYLKHTCNLRTTDLTHYDQHDVCKNLGVWA